MPERRAGQALPHETTKRRGGWVLGWDVGGAHLKACLLHDGRLQDVAQWACPLWQGMAQLDLGLALAAARWPQAGQAWHAVTMTGEMTDLFADRADGVQRIAARFEAGWPQRVRLFAGASDWCRPARAGERWADIASANWRATALLAARRLPRGLLVDIGSTTTDLILFEAGGLVGPSRSDRDRLASGELVYQGVVRTPLCALARRIAFQGQSLNVMNEFFATTADVYRLTGELDPAHDLHPAADGAAKDLPATRARLGRMVGCDARDGSEGDWRDFAGRWRAAQLERLAEELQRLLRDRRRDLAGAAVVAAGCGAFLLPDLLARLDPALGATSARICDFGAILSPDAADGDDNGLRDGARLCAPSVAVGALFAQADNNKETV
ncbi:MAG: H4MPT-linked C1 transfer pathway protein [Burkholderiaceae bacterium]|nr:H4MPT-linked C1 transfer pathway protein [Burkholderiaceae bacterium]